MFPYVVFLEGGGPTCQGCTDGGRKGSKRYALEVKKKKSGVNETVKQEMLGSNSLSA